jgi:hypothetical protein
LNHDDLQRNIVGYLVSQGAWDRAVSLDIEADLKTLEEPRKPILSISIARRVNGQVETRNLILESETLEAEMKLMGDLATLFQQLRPLVIMGYGLNSFDHPILTLKQIQLDAIFERNHSYTPAYWYLREVLSRSYFLDVIDPVRFEVAKFDSAKPRFLGLEQAMKHPRFAHLPFRGKKSIVSDLMTSRGMNKWDAIHYLWQNDRPNFEEYITGDSYDTLLITEDLFGMGVTV